MTSKIRRMDWTISQLRILPPARWAASVTQAWAPLVRRRSLSLGVQRRSPPPPEAQTKLSQPPTPPIIQTKSTKTNNKERKKRVITDKLKIQKKFTSKFLAETV